MVINVNCNASLRTSSLTCLLGIAQPPLDESTANSLCYNYIAAVVIGCTNGHKDIGFPQWPMNKPPNQLTVIQQQTDRELPPGLHIKGAKQIRYRLIEASRCLGRQRGIAYKGSNFTHANSPELKLTEINKRRY